MSEPLPPVARCARCDKVEPVNAWFVDRQLPAGWVEYEMAAVRPKSDVAFEWQYDGELCSRCSDKLRAVINEFFMTTE